MKERNHAFGKEEYSFLDNVIFSRRRRQVVKRLPATPRRLADFGAGYDCRMIAGLYEQFSETTFVAVDTEYDQGLSVHSRLELVISDLNNPVAIDDASLDVVISLAVLEHLDAPQTMLNEMYRTLKPGGRVLLTTPGPTSKPLLEFLALRLKVIDAHEILDHKNYFSSDDLKQMFVAAGFSENKVHPETFIFGMNNIVTAVK